MPTPNSRLLLELSPLSLLRILWKRKISVVAIWAALSVCTAIVVKRLPAIYRADALILVDSQKIPEHYVSSTVNTDVQDRIAAITQQLLSRSRLTKMMEDFNLYQEERQKFYPEEVLDIMRRDISILPERSLLSNRTGAFRVAYYGKDPNIVAQVANRIANLYIEENLKTREVQAEGTSEFIDAQLKEAKKRLDELEAAVSHYKVSHNGELPQQENSLHSILGRLQVSLEVNRDAINRAQQSKMLLQNTLNAATDMAVAQERAQRTATAAASLADRRTEAAAERSAADPPTRVETLEAQLRSLRIRYSDQHPEVKRVEAELHRLKTAEAQVREAKPANMPAAPRPAPATAASRTPAATLSPELAQTRERIAGLQSQLALAAQELEGRKAEQARIQREIGQYESKLTRLPIREQEMSQITRDYEISKANYRSLLDKKIAAEMATEMEHRQKSERFTIGDTARVPGRPFRPNRPLLAGLGSAFGLLLGLVWAFGNEFRRGMVLGEWELPANAVVLGRIPQIERPQRRAVAYESGAVIGPQ
jgi:polysaccharide chain length determinant protein (PEP-CTERM system associated)